MKKYFSLFFRSVFTLILIQNASFASKFGLASTNLLWSKTKFNVCFVDDVNLLLNPLIAVTHTKNGFENEKLDRKSVV